MRDYGKDKDNWMKSRYCHFVCTVTVFHSWKTYVRNDSAVLLIIQILKLEPDLIIKFYKFPKRYTSPWPVVNTSPIYLSLLAIEKGGIYQEMHSKTEAPATHRDYAQRDAEFTAWLKITYPEWWKEDSSFELSSVRTDLQLRSTIDV